MDKNPISFLQENLMKRQIIPTYDVIESRCGTHLNWFKMRVTCGNQYANGEGSSKKVAKANAAKAMIALMEMSSCFGSIPMSMNNVTNNNVVTNCTSPSSVNYVGRLQEMAMRQDKVLPEYKDKLQTGPSHNPTFTTLCKFMDLEVEASAPTKKESKTLAAKIMLERISVECANVTVCESGGELKSYLETIENAVSDLKIHDECKNSMAESTKKALELYLPLSKINPSKKVNLNDQRSYNEYHTFLRDAFSDKDREHTIDKLKETIRACQPNNENTSKPMALLKSALSELKINIKEINYSPRNRTYIFGLQLDTDPVISEIGHGDTESSAIMQSIYQMALTLTIMIA